MKQHFENNTQYEILTPTGWEDFDGIIFNESAKKPSKQLTFDDSTSIIATLEHRFYIQGKEISVNKLKIGDQLDSVDGPKTINGITELILEHTYDIFNTISHKIVANCLYSHQCDEFSYVNPNIANEFWTSISPTLATGGKAMITSTPNSDEDMFATIWRESQHKFDGVGNEISDGTGINGFFGYCARWDEHPDRDEKWKIAEIGRIGEEQFRREYGTEFLIYEETLINSLKLNELIGKDPILKLGDVRWYKKPTPGNFYLAALDPSLGTGGNYSGIQVFELPNFVQIAEWRNNITPTQQQVRILRDMLKYIQEEIGREYTNHIYWSCENNTVGEAALIAIDDLGEETFPGLFLSEPGKKGHIRKFRKGFNTTFGNKIPTCSRLKYLVEENKMTIYSKPLISELKAYIASGFSFKAKAGQSDDLVSALLLLIRMSVVLSEWDQRIFDSISSGDTKNDEEIILPMPIFISTMM